MLCEVLQERAHQLDLMSMLTEVNGKLTRMTGNTSEGETALQTCEFTATLRKQLYFNPDLLWSEYRAKAGKS